MKFFFEKHFKVILFFIIILFLIIGCKSLNTNNRNESPTPAINNEDFQDWTPWWFELEDYSIYEEFNIII